MGDKDESGEALGKMCELLPSAAPIGDEEDISECGDMQYEYGGGDGEDEGGRETEQDALLLLLRVLLRVLLLLMVLPYAETARG